MFQWEMRVAEFPTGMVDLRVGIFLLSLKISDQSFIPHAIKKTVPSSLVAHTEKPKQNDQYGIDFISDKKAPGFLDVHIAGLTYGCHFN